jgi:molybdopterin adenylyltransferase
VRAAIITVSTSVAAGESEDLSGRELAELAAAAGVEIVAREVVADDRGQIEALLRRHSSPEARTPLIFTTGGTGLTEDDVTPEATRAVIDREAPGFVEAMRAESLRHTPMGVISRAVSGIAGRTLIINFPGNPRSIRQLFGVIAPVLEHAVATLERERGARTPGH